MPKRKLVEAFRPKHYELELNRNDQGLSGKLSLSGKKVGRPSKRLTLHQRKLKISSAKLFRIDKKGEIAIPVVRINHHQSFEELRLHTHEVLMPGEYRLELDFTGPANDQTTLGKLAAGQWTSARHIFPLIDETEAEAVYNVHCAKS